MSRIYIRCSESEMIKIKKAFSFNCPFDEGTVDRCGEGESCDACIEAMVTFNLIQRKHNPIYRCAEDFDVKMFRREIRVFKGSPWHVGEYPSSSSQSFLVRMLSVEKPGFFIDITFECFMEYFDKELTHEIKQTNP